MFLEQQINIYIFFLLNHISLKSEIMAAKIELYMTEINYKLMYVKVFLIY